MAIANAQLLAIMAHPDGQEERSYELNEYRFPEDPTAGQHRWYFRYFDALIAAIEERREILKEAGADPIVIRVAFEGLNFELDELLEATGKVKKLNRDDKKRLGVKRGEAPIDVIFRNRVKP
jgi:hypothetical protein